MRVGGCKWVLVCKRVGGSSENWQSENGSSENGPSEYKLN